jgi:hypothetical protein
MIRHGDRLQGLNEIGREARDAIERDPLERDPIGATAAVAFPARTAAAIAPGAPRLAIRRPEHAECGVGKPSQSARPRNAAEPRTVTDTRSGDPCRARDPRTARAHTPLLNREQRPTPGQEILKRELDERPGDPFMLFNLGAIAVERLRPRPRAASGRN